MWSPIRKHFRPAKPEPPADLCTFRPARYTLPTRPGQECRLTFLHDSLLLVDSPGEVALAHRLGLALTVLEVLPRGLEDLAELKRDRRGWCDLILAEHTNKCRM